MRSFAKFIPAGSVVLGLTTLGSYVLGLLRDRIFAQTFGASRLLDAYNAAFLLPDFLFNVLVASGIAAAVVPIFLDLAKLDRDRAQKYLNTVLTAAVAVMGLVGLIVIIFAKPLGRLVAPGFAEADLALLVELLRLLAISPIVFAASNALGAILVAKRQFLFYGLSPMLYNLGIIGGTLFLSPDFGIKGVAIGTLGGALLHLGARIFDARSLLADFKIAWQIKTAEFRKTIKLMIPKMFGHPVELATFWGFTAMASLLAPGSIAILNFARNFQSVPVSLVGIVIATTSFPILAQAVSDRDLDHFRKTLKTSFWLILLVSVLAALVAFIFREVIIGILLGGKAFTALDVQRTAATFGMFTLSIPTEALSHLLARAFYATKNTLLPVIATLMSFVVAIALGWVLAPVLHLEALPLAFFLGSLVKLVFLMGLLSGRLARL